MNNRNHSCSCRSGKKFKNCCGSAAKKSQEYHEWKAALKRKTQEILTESKSVKPKSKLSPLEAMTLAAALLTQHDNH